MANPAHSDNPERTINLGTSQAEILVQVRPKLVIPAKSAKIVGRPQQETTACIHFGPI
jgi:hypothetical protein